MKFIDKIRKISEKNEKSYREEKTVIRNFKEHIKNKAKKGCREAYWFCNTKNSMLYIYDIEYIVKYFKEQGFEVSACQSCSDLDKTKIICKW